MSKIVIFGLALAMVLSGGPFIGARADNIAPSCWEGFCPDIQSDMDQPRNDTGRQERDLDRYDSNYQRENRYGPSNRVPMGSPGF
jgi:hypothetical protein